MFIISFIQSTMSPVIQQTTC